MRQEQKNILLLSARRRLFFLRELKKHKNFYHVNALLFSDENYMDPMRKEADEFIIIEPLKNKEDILRLKQECQIHNVKLVIPWHDHEIEILSENQEYFEDIKLLVPPAKYTKIFLDKWVLYTFFKDKDILLPKTNLRSNLEKLIGQLIAKPRRGQGGVGVRKISNTEETSQLTDNYIIQEFIEGTEYTCDVWLNEDDSKPFFIVPRKRIKVRGEVMIAQVDNHPAILKAVENICSHLKFTGMLNIQLMLNNGKAYLIEINPRFGGGSDLTIAAGGNFPKYILEYVFSGRVESEKPSIIDQLIMTRYYDSFFYKPENTNDWIETL